MLWILLARKWNSWRYSGWLSWLSPSSWCFSMLPGKNAIYLIDQVVMGTLDQHAPVFPLALWGDVTSLLCQSASSHFFLLAASIRWPHSVCCSQGVQETSTYKTKSFWSPKTSLKLWKKLLFAEKRNTHSIIKEKSVFIEELKEKFNKWEETETNCSVSCFA